MSGVNIYPGKFQGKIHNVVVADEKINAFPKKKSVTSEKVTTSEEVEKCTKNG